MHRPIRAGRRNIGADETDDQRRHPRFTLDVADVSGSLLSGSAVIIINMGLGGISIKAETRLDIGREYFLRLRDRRMIISLRGTVIWSVLAETRKTARGEIIPVYRAGMRFVHLTSEKTDELAHFIENCRCPFGAGNHMTEGMEPFRTGAGVNLSKGGAA